MIPHPFVLCPPGPAALGWEAVAVLGCFLDRRRGGWRRW